MIRQLVLALLLAMLAGNIDAAPERVVTSPALDSASALRNSQAAIGRTVGNHLLLDRREQPVRLRDYRGKPLLVSFIYTGCFRICPTTTQSLAVAVGELAQVFGADTFNVVSIGFNQPFDSPTAMRVFAAQMRIDMPNWDFLSPSPSTVDDLLSDFGFLYAATPAGIDHVLTVSMLDAQGRIYAQVYGENLSRDQLGEPLRQLLNNAPLRPGISLTEVVERVRILCTVYDPTTGKYRYNYGLILEIAGGVTFALAMIWYFVLEWRTQRLLRRVAQSSSIPLANLPR
ncbi:MAG: SCO family protein [Betaproteobacteria bacterium]